MEFIGATRRIFKTGSKEKDEDENCEYEMIWDAEGAMHLVKKARNAPVASSSDTGLTARCVFMFILHALGCLQHVYLFCA